jgi:hypothetical protein
MGKAGDSWIRWVDSLIGLHTSSKVLLPLIKMIVDYVAPTNWLFSSITAITIYDPLFMKVISKRSTLKYINMSDFEGHRIVAIAKRTSDSKCFIMDNAYNPTIYRLDIDFATIDSDDENVNWLKMTKMPQQMSHIKMRLLVVSTGTNLFIRTQVPSWICFDLQTESWNSERSLPISPAQVQEYFPDGSDFTSSSAAAIGPCSFIVFESIISEHSSVRINCYCYDASDHRKFIRYIDVRHINSKANVLTSGRISQNTVMFVLCGSEAVLIPIKNDCHSSLEFHPAIIRDISLPIDVLQRDRIFTFYFICDSNLMVLVESCDLDDNHCYSLPGALDIYQLCFASWKWEKILTMNGDRTGARFSDFVEI